MRRLPLRGGYGRAFLPRKGLFCLYQVAPLAVPMSALQPVTGRWVAQWVARVPSCCCTIASYDTDAVASDTSPQGETPPHKATGLRHQTLSPPAPHARTHACPCWLEVVHGTQGGRAARAATTRRAPPRTLPPQRSLMHPVSCWHRLAPRLPRHDSYTDATVWMFSALLAMALPHLTHPSRTTCLGAAAPPPGRTSPHAPYQLSCTARR